MYKHFLHSLTGISLLISLFVCAQDGPVTNSGSSSDKNTLRFLVMGDWGVRGKPNQQRVADAMGNVATQSHPSFIISTGDNFYPGGVISPTDSQWIWSYERVYRAPSLQVTWFPVLGNHDYILDPDAQVAYTRYSHRWYMPARYYDTSFAIGMDSVLFVFLDTDPIDKYLRHQPYDSVRYPEGSALRQVEWMEQVLSSSHAKWKFVVGHHPVHSGGTNRHNRRTRRMRNLLSPVFNRHKVDMYLCGHEHHLEYLKKRKDHTHYIISGGGSSNGHYGYLKFYRKFGAKKLGFVNFELTSEQLYFEFVDDKESIIYRGTIVK